MAFPQDPLEVLVEVRAGQSWIDITDDAYHRDILTIDRGRDDEAGSLEPSRCTLTLNNGASRAAPGISGRYSPRNPNSDLYGLIGRNTPIRIHARGPEPHLRIIGAAGDRARVASAAELDIAGDLDVRLEFALAELPTQSSTFANQVNELIGRYDTAGNARMWRLVAGQSGTLVLSWSTDGATFTDRVSTDVLPVVSGQRAAVRATLDVDDGAGGHVVRFYTAASIAGPWTQLGQDIVTAGTTSINTSGAADLQIGDISVDTFAPGAGRYFTAEVRNGIDGTLVANPDFTAQTQGATSFTDAAGRSWQLQGSAEITAFYRRLWGEVAAWPARWDVDAHDVWVPLEVAGVLRRHRQGAKPLQSTLRKRIPSGDPLAYWPMEDGPLTTAPASPVPGVAPLTVRGMTFAADTSLPSADALPTLGNSSSLRGEVPGAAAGGWHTEMVYRLQTMPATERTMLRLYLANAGSSVTAVRVRISTAGIRVQALDDDDTVVAFFLFTDPDAIADFTGVWNRLQLYSFDSGPSTFVCVAWRDVSANTLWVVNTAFTGNPGKITSVRGEWGSDFTGMAIGHLGVWDTGGNSTTDAGVDVYAGADDGFAGERALARMRRVADEENLEMVIPGIPGESMAVGPQRIATVLDVVDDCAAADGGLLYENRETPALAYLPRYLRYNRTPQLVLHYDTDGEVAPPLEPVDDDQKTRNDVTVTRLDGGSGRAVLDDGPLSVQAPPDGVGTYDDQVTLNLHTDDQTEPVAAWRLHLGTVDEARYPKLTVDLAAAPHLIGLVLSLDIGAVIEVQDLPAWLPPGAVRLVVEGYTEHLGQYDWTLEFNCSPASPWTVAVTDDPVLGKADTDGSELLAPAGADDTELIVRATAGSPWTTDPAETPWDIRLGGEVATVTAVAHSISDPFDRVATSGWGTAPSGEAWSISGGVATDYAVSAGTARHLCSTLSTARLTVLTPAISDDFNLYCKVGVVETSTGGSQFAGVAGRYTDAANLYYLRIEFTTTAAGIMLSLRKRVADTDSELISNIPNLAYTASGLLNTRFQAIGTELLGKAWLLGDPEPRSWNVVATDTDHTTGQVGTRSIVTSSNTNTNPTLVYDDFQVADPQVFTVTRAVNGITKAHPAGAPLSLAHPAIVAL